MRLLDRFHTAYVENCDWEDIVPKICGERFDHSMFSDKSDVEIYICYT
jgi:hypothetical protein